MTAAVVLVLVLGVLFLVVYRVTRHPEDQRPDAGRCYCGRNRPVLPPHGAAHRGPVLYGGCDHGGTRYRAPFDQVCARCEREIPAGEPTAVNTAGDPLHVPDCPSKKARVHA